MFAMLAFFEQFEYSMFAVFALVSFIANQAIELGKELIPQVVMFRWGNPSTTSTKIVQITFHFVGATGFIQHNSIL